MKSWKEFSMKRIAAVLSSVGLAASSAPVLASQLFTISNGVYSANAVFTTGDGTLNIVLTDTAIVPPHDVSQLLSDLSFSISGDQTIGTTLVTPTLTAGSNTVTCTHTGCTTGGSGSLNAWRFGANGSAGGSGMVGGGEFLLTALAGNPKTLIMGSALPSCSPSCGSFGAPDFRPFAQTSATFRLSGLTGVSAGSTISDVSFSFGTQPETVLAAVPIPAAAWLFGSSLLGLIAVARRRAKESELRAPASEYGAE